MSEERGWSGRGLLPLLDTAVSSRCRPVRSLVARGGAEAGVCSQTLTATPVPHLDEVGAPGARTSPKGQVFVHVRRLCRRSRDVYLGESASAHSSSMNRLGGEGWNRASVH